jgi:hypothetical protein
MEKRCRKQASVVIKIMEKNDARGEDIKPRRKFHIQEKTYANVPGF